MKSLDSIALITRLLVDYAVEQAGLCVTLPEALWTGFHLKGLILSLLFSSWHLHFLRSEFKGQLPKPYSSEALATRLIPTDMNDMNKEEMSRYVRNCHYANMPMQYSAIFHGCKNDNFQMKNCDIFLILAQNIDRGYTLEPPQ